jgi:hypothetical protein
MMASSTFAPLPESSSMTYVPARRRRRRLRQLDLVHVDRRRLQNQGLAQPPPHIVGDEAPVDPNVRLGEMRRISHHQIPALIVRYPRQTVDW